MKEELSAIKKLISEGKADHAINLLMNLTSSSSETANTDEIYYLLGNAYRKQGNFQEALNSYLEAIDRNPESPAVEAKEMLLDILNYYNKEMYNP
ncbi:MAG: tetratricopeptide repeat protein [Phocaeicola sp.]